MASLNLFQAYKITTTDATHARARPRLWGR